MDTKPLGAAGGGNVPLDYPVGDVKAETVNKVVAKVVDGVVSKSRISSDSLVAQSVANSLALSMGLAAAKLMSPADLALLLKTAQSKIEQSMITLSKNDIERTQQEQKDQAEVRLKNLQEQIEKANKAQKGGLIGKIFGWIAAAFMAIAGAILIATGVAAGAGAALLVGGIAMMVALALQEPGKDGISPMSKFITAMADAFAAGGLMTKEQAHGLATGIAAAIFVAASIPAFIFAGPAGGIAVLGSLLPLLVTPDQLMLMGMKDEDAQKLSLALSISMAIVAIAVTAGPALASAVSSAAGKLSSIVANISDDVSAFLAKAATKAAGFSESATNMMGPMTKTVEAFSEKLAGRLADFFKMTGDQMRVAGQAGSTVAQIGQGTTMVGSGVASIVTADATSSLTKARAEEKLLDAFMQNLTDKFQNEKERLEELIRKLMNFDPIVAMMQSTFEAASFVERHS